MSRSIQCRAARGSTGGPKRLVASKLHLSHGLEEGVKRGLDNLPIALYMITVERMHLGAPRKIKDGK